MLSNKVLLTFPFEHEGIHGCSLAVVTCYDFRFRRQARKFIKKYFKQPDYDPISFPGVAKVIIEHCNDQLISDWLDIPTNAHGISTIVLINHQDCKAYGGSRIFNNNPEAEQRFHEEELRKARTIFKEKYPHVNVFLVYARLVKGQVEFVEVK